MHKLMRYIKGYEKQALLAPLFKMLEACFELFVPLVIASIIDTGIKNEDAAFIWTRCGLLVLLAAIGLASSLTAQWFSATAALGFGTALRKDLFRHIGTLSYSELDGIGTPTLVTRMTSDINQVQNGVNLTLRLDDADIALYHDNFHPQPRYIPLSQPMPLLANTPFIVTGSGKFFRNVQLDPAANLGVVKVDSDGAGYHILWGLTNEAVPTSELPAHFLSHCERIKATNGKDRVIMHCHATNLIALTYVLENDTAVFTRQLWEGSTECLVVFPDGVGILPWMVPGTDEIGQATAQEMQKHSLVLWPFHGVFGSGSTLDETFGLIDTAEKSAQVLVKVYSMGGMKQTISREELIALGKRFGVTPLASALAL